jgi:TIR domain
MSDIFISYSKADHALALKLSAFLEAEGWTVWWDKSLAAADLYRDEIMKQLAAARAVITIWTENSVKSDWVRAEAGRAKVDGKLIPVKTADVAYGDIPLPFGEMHTENIGSNDLIRAAIVAQLAKPAVQQSAFWQIRSTFKYQVLTWIGIIGSAITLFANLSGVLNLADWARELVAHWHEWNEWNQIIWGWLFSLINIKLPRHFATIISFIGFTTALVVGTNLAARTGTAPHNGRRVMIKISIVFGGVLLFFVTFAAYTATMTLFLATTNLMTLHDSDGHVTEGFLTVGWVWILGFTIAYLSCFVKDRLWVLINSVLFICMMICLLNLPLSDITAEEWVASAFGVLACVGCWMAVILFSPLRQLARRLSFVVLGVLTLVALSEISKLNLHQYLQPPKGSDNLVR